jgi:zinc protease
LYQRAKWKWILALLLFFLLSASLAEAGLKNQVFETTLANGLKVILLENHKVPLITFQIWYRVGSRNEEWGKTGLSHMLEHMMFKGTAKVGPGEFSRIIQENGGNDNAFTSSDFTAYFENLRSDRVQVSIHLESDRMHNLILRENDFRTERMVVMEERRLRTQDNPKAFLHEQVKATAFQVSPYHWPTIGWMEDIARFTLEDLKRYYRTYYNPANAFLVVVGDFRREEILSRIRETFGSIPQGISPNQKKDRDPAQVGERRVLVKKEAHLPFLIIGYHVPNLRDPDSYTLEVIAALLTEGKSSRLYQSLVRDQRLVLSVDGENPLLSRDPDLFYLSAEILEGKAATDVERALDREMERLQREPVGSHELQKAKNQLESSFIYSQGSLFSQAMLLAEHEIAIDWKTVDDYLPSIRKVSPQDIQRVARRYLIPENRTVGNLQPLPLQGKKIPSPGSPFQERMVK